jgi:predicted metal-binding protein
MRTQIVATPSCGVPPHFEVHTANFDNTLYQFDWNLVNRLTPEVVEGMHDTESLEKVLYSFVDSKYGAVEQQFLPFPLSAKFYRLLQLGTDYLLKKLAVTQRQVGQKDKEIDYLRHKLEKSIEALDRVPRVANADVTLAHSCPVCSRAFKALLYLDKHMTQCHPELVDAWRCLRERRPYGLAKALQELHQDVGHLRSCLTRQDLPKCCAHQDGFDRMPRSGPPGGRKGGTRPVGGTGRFMGVTEVQPGANRRNFFLDDPLLYADSSLSTEAGELV